MGESEVKKVFKQLSCIETGCTVTGYWEGGIWNESAHWPGGV